MDEEKALIETAQVDALAFEKLITIHEKNIYNIAYRIMHNKHDAQDMAQESIIKAFKNIKSFRKTCLFSSWIYRITVNTCLDELRKRKRNKQVLVDITDSACNDFIDEKLLPHDELENKELLSSVMKAISTLNEKYQIVIMLRDVQGFSYQEISEITQTNIGTVKSRINRARNILQEAIDLYGT